MKKFVTAALVIAFMVPCSQLLAQGGKKNPKKELEEKMIVEERVAGMPADGKETQEIIIRKKGDKDVNVTVEIKGDKILVNGKPLAEFKGDGVTINKRTMHILGGDNLQYRLRGNIENGLNEDMLQGWSGDNFQFWNDDSGREEKTTFLGVTTEDAEDGAKIAEVSKGSAAEKAGLKEDDIITKVGSTKIDGPSALADAIKAKKPKEEVSITYKRDGKESTVKTTLGEKVQKNVRVFSMAGPGHDGMNWDGDMNEVPRTMTIPRVQRVPGVNLNREFSAQDFAFSFGRPKLGLKIQDLEEGDGVKVIEVEKETAAEKAGLKKDDIITEIGGKKIKNTDDAREELSPEPGKTSYSIKAKRNGTEMTFDVKVPKKIKTASF
jgi:serine protease Do